MISRNLSNMNVDASGAGADLIQEDSQGINHPVS